MQGASNKLCISQKLHVPYLYLADLNISIYGGNGDRTIRTLAHQVIQSVNT
jgi:hypothetical protein